jgi:hypothetical protein
VHGVWLEQHWRAGRRRLAEENGPTTGDNHAENGDVYVGETPPKDEGAAARISKSSRRRSFGSRRRRRGSSSLFGSSRRRRRGSMYGGSSSRRRRRGGSSFGVGMAYGSSGSDYDDYWQYHFEVSVPSQPGWPRADACYTDSCGESEYNDEDDAAYYLNEMLNGACEDAGYAFDSGITDFDDTELTNQAFQAGVNCAAPGPPPLPTPTPAPGVSSMAAQVQPYPTPSCGCTSTSGMCYNYHCGATCSNSPCAHHSPGAAVGGGAFRTSQPCQCEATYPCMYLEEFRPDTTVPPRVKMSMEPRDPTWHLWLMLVICGVLWVCCMGFSCFTFCGSVGGCGPMSSGAKFNRLY